jgi:hypothetical protein
MQDQHPRSAVAEREPAPFGPPPSFWRLLYRFLFFDWLFADVSRARNLYERHAASRHNRRMSRYLPVYLRRWMVLMALGFALGCLFERGTLTILSAWFFTWSCVAFTAVVVTALAWAFLASDRLS